MKILRKKINQENTSRILIVIAIVVMLAFSVFLLSPEKRARYVRESQRATDMRTIGNAVNLTITEQEDITVDHILTCSADSPKMFTESCATKIGLGSTPVDPLGLPYRIGKTEEGLFKIWSPAEESKWGYTEDDAQIF